MTEKSNRISHESFGVIEVSRVQTRNQRLFGTPLLADETIRLSICGASVERNLSQEYIYSDNKPHIEVEMSYGQWAHMLSSMNAGHTTVTIKHYRTGGLKIADPVPAHMGTTDTFKKEVGKYTQEAVDSAKDAVGMLNNLLAQKTIRKSDVEALRDKLNRVQSALNSSVPFVQSQFAEAVEGMLDDAKQNYEAFVQNTALRIGFQSMGDKITPEIAAALEDAVKKGIIRIEGVPTLSIADQAPGEDG